MNHVDSAYIARMDNEIAAFEGIDRFGTQQAVRIGNDAHDGSAHSLPTLAQERRSTAASLKT
jgi:hypothetical protein